MVVMPLIDIGVLEKHEASLARVLIKAEFVPEKAVQDFIDYKKNTFKTGKPYLGKVLVDMKYISQAALDEFVDENNEAHTKFMETLLKEGYLTDKQSEMLFEKKKETGNDLITLISELNIMTKENYTRIFNNRSYTFKLGEWLVLKNKISQDNLDMALKMRNISSLEEYLLLHGLLKKPVLDKVKEKMAAATSA